MFAYYLDLALRSLKRNPVLTGLMVLAIAVGIGASMTTLTVMHVLSGDPLPGKSGRLFYAQVDGDPTAHGGTLREPPDMLDYRSALDLWGARRADRQALIADSPVKASTQDAGRPPLMLTMLSTTADFFSMFDVPFAAGRGWTAGVHADHWQLADFTLTESILPYNRMPRAFLNWEQRFGSVLRYGLGAEAVRFQHTVHDAGARVDLRPWISAPLEGDAWFLRPTLAYRYTGYSLDDGLALALGGGSPSRGQSIFSLDAGVYFDRQARIKGKDYLQTIEPRIFYLRGLAGKAARVKARQDWD